MSSLSKTPFSSISFTSGRTFSSANWRMLSRKRISSSVKLVRGVGEGSWRTSGIQAPSHEYGEPRILAPGDAIQESKQKEFRPCDRRIPVLNHRLAGCAGFDFARGRPRVLRYPT